MKSFMSINQCSHTFFINPGLLNLSVHAVSVSICLVCNEDDKPSELDSRGWCWPVDSLQLLPSAQCTSRRPTSAAQRHRQVSAYIQSRSHSRNHTPNHTATHHIVNSRFIIHTATHHTVKTSSIRFICSQWSST